MTLTQNQTAARTSAHQSERESIIEVTSSRRTSSDARPIKLTEAQQVVLVRASQNEDGELIKPRPDNRTGSREPETGFGSTLNDKRMIVGFCNKGLIEGNADDLYSLRLTATAFVALHIDWSEWPERLRSYTNADADADTSALDAIVEGPHLKDTDLIRPATSLRAGSKGAAVVQLLQREGGTTLAEMEAATGWQTHSVRGFLSGTVRKKLGLELVSSKGCDGVRTYHIALDVEAGEDTESAVDADHDGVTTVAMGDAA